MAFVDKKDKCDMEYFDQVFAYDGDDLGAKYTKEKTGFKIWAPTAEKVLVNLYEHGESGNPFDMIPMKKGKKGTWHCEKYGDIKGFYYTYTVKFNDITNETVDIYAKAVGVNGNRGMVVDLKATNPEGFENDVKPSFENPTDACIYELHIRDVSMDDSSGIKNKGKFLALRETGTKNRAGYSTGLDHIKDLGVTHVQLLPCFDYASVDETQPENNEYNWGYDPKNYDVPEGSYSTDPNDGAVRIREMKEMVMALHENGLRVIMDVVYNHTYDIANSWFQKTVPDYYYRKTDAGYSNASGCGNETASDRLMFRKYMVDSVTYWAREYHIDGFRFDLMAVHDMDTICAIRQALDKIDPTIMVYGEGWTAQTAAIPYYEQALKANIGMISGVGAFNDDIRDAIKGSVFNFKGKGFVNGGSGYEERVRFGIVGSIDHPQTGIKGWAKAPGQSINYISCHDNLTFWDKLTLSNKSDSLENRIRMTKLGAAILFTSQGVPFIQAGEEILRSKDLDENSYKSPDKVNSIKWDEKTVNIDTYEYYKGLIAFRKANPEFRLKSADEIKKHLSFINADKSNVVAYRLENIIAIFNANSDCVEINIPKGDWNIYVNDKEAGTNILGTVKDVVTVAPISALVLKMQ
jgi:pullulanase